MGIMSRRRQTVERKIFGAVETPNVQTPEPENKPLEPEAQPEELTEGSPEIKEAAKQFVNNRRRR